MCFALSGCAFGGGPVIGYRLDHGGGFVAGIEGGGGFAVAQVNVGIDSVGQQRYIRYDLADDVAGLGVGHGGDATEHVGGRVGWGHVAGGGDVFAAGVSWENYNASQSPCAGVTVGVLYVEVRYERGWQLVANPRLEAHSGFCKD